MKHEKNLIDLACYSVEQVFGGTVKATKVTVKEKFFSVTADGTYEIEVERGKWVTLEAEVKYSIDDEGLVGSYKAKAKLLPGGARVGNAKELLAAYNAVK